MCHRDGRPKVEHALAGFSNTNPDGNSAMRGSTLGHTSRPMGSVHSMTL